MSVSSWDVFTAAAEQTIAEAAKTDEPVCLLLVTPVPSQTQPGDDAAIAHAVATMSNAVLRMLRRDDLIGAYSAEKIAVFGAHTDEEGALRLAERIERTLSVRELAVNKPMEPKAAIGIAILPHHGRTLEDLLKSAEDSLAGALKNENARVAVGQITPGESAGTATISRRARTSAQAAPLASRRLEALHHALVTTGQSKGAGIAILTEPEVCPSCRNAAMEVYEPSSVPLLPFNRCTNPAGCRCVYSVGPLRRQRKGSLWTAFAKLLRFR